MERKISYNWIYLLKFEGSYHKDITDVIKYPRDLPCCSLVLDFGAMLHKAKELPPDYTVPVKEESSLLVGSAF